MPTRAPHCAPHDTSDFVIDPGYRRSLITAAERRVGSPRSTALHALLPDRPHRTPLAARASTPDDGGPATSREHTTVESITGVTIPRRYGRTGSMAAMRSALHRWAVRRTT